MPASRSRAGRQRAEPSDSRRESRQHSTSTWEWISAALGALLIAAAIGYLVVQRVTQPESNPPSVIIQPLGVSAVSGGFVVRFRAQNTSTSTASTVLVSGELKEGDVTVEESEVQLDYVPQRSEREGGLFFTRDPSRYRVEMRAEGYVKP